MSMLDGPFAAHMPNSNRPATINKDLGTEEKIELKMHLS